PIYKTDEELKEEQDSAMKQFKPYFILDSAKQEKNIQKFQDFVYEMQIDSSSIITRGSSQLNDSCFMFVEDILKEIYQSGIFNVNDLFYTELDNYNSIFIIENNIAREREIKDLFTPKEAYEQLVGEFKYVCFNHEYEKSTYDEIIKELNLNTFIEPNLSYDKKRSDNVSTSIIEDISLTRGLIQAGELIILKGDFVNAKKYKILQSLKIQYENRLGGVSRINIILIGQILIIASCFLVLYLFLLNFRPEILKSNKQTIFVLLIVFLMIMITRLVLQFSNVNVYLIPFALVPVLVWTFFDSRLAVFVLLIVILIAGFLVPNSFEFVMINFITGNIALYSVKNLYRRGKLFLTGGLVILSYSVLFLGISIMHEGNFQAIDWAHFAWFGGNGLLLLTAFPLIFIFEKLFGFLSDNTLIELSDTNQALLRRLAEEAPGTFQHSIQVANLAEEALHKIGFGNPLLVRTGALYHDIGKLENPVYFTENQVSGYNPHDGLPFEKSAEIIIKHVHDGVKLAKKYNLPKQIIDFIQTHHGTTQVKYFYRNFINQFPDKEDQKIKFTYPGPRPFSRETAVLMMADTVEAASRSLKDPTAEALNGLVDTLIDAHVDDNQFENTNITFRDIAQIRSIFKRKLLNIYHVRIEYPKETNLKV
ncbi:HD family phosphohydrolase, partial [Bacteroidota bacterium]